MEKKGAMEMSVGTIVTIVLLMAVLILGIYLVQQIFKTEQNVIDQIDRNVNTEINKLFSNDENKKIIVYPEEPVIKKENSGGVGLSIRNIEQKEEIYSYQVLYKEDDCNLGEGEALSLISLGQSDENIRVASGSSMDSAVLVRFRTGESTPLCLIRYRIEVEKNDGSIYSWKDFDLEIKS